MEPVSHLLHRGRPACDSDPESPVVGLFTAAAFATTCGSCVQTEAWTRLRTKEQDEAAEDDDISYVCGSANCGAVPAWHDPDGIGWCLQHMDGGLHAPPEPHMTTGMCESPWCVLPRPHQVPSECVPF